jgi:hypothetical protein
MKQILQAVVTSLFVFLSCSEAFADQERRYTLAEHGAIALNLPAGWVDQVQQPRPDLPPTIIFQPAAGAPFQVLVTPLWPMRPNIPKLTPETLNTEVRAAIEHIRNQSVEKEFPLQSLNAPGMFGTYFSGTDRNAKPGEFKFLTQGMLSLAELRVTFTILTNEGQGRVVDKALGMLKSMRREVKVSGGDNGSVRLFTAASPWELVFPAWEWKLELQKRRPDGLGVYSMFSNERTKVSVSVYIEPADKCKTAAACRSQYWSDPGPLVQNPKAVVQFEDNGFAVVKFLMPSIEGVAVNQLNYSAHTVRDGYWVDMHISKAASTPQDEALFKSLLHGVSFQAKAQ